MILDYGELFKPYTKNGATLERTIIWLKKQTGADDAIIDRVLADTFLDIKQGKTFPTDKCPCCGVEEANAAIEHELLKEVKIKQKEASESLKETINKGLNDKIIHYMELDNLEFTEQNMPKSDFWRMDKSVVLKTGGKILKWIGMK